MTEPFTIQPPPLPTTYDLAGSGLFVAKEQDSEYYKPLRGEVLGLIDGVNDVLIQPFVTNRAVVALDIGVLLWLTRLDALDCDVQFPSPFQPLRRG